MIALVSVLLAIAALCAILYFARNSRRPAGNLDQLAAQLRPVDVRAFRNLMDQDEEQFLRENLPYREFRTIHCQRMLAAAEYVRCASRNAAILVTLAQAAQQSTDPKIAAAANRLLENALHFRLYALRTIPFLHMAIVFPGIRRTPEFFADTYDSMARQVVMLGCLRYPTHGMSSAL
jgi:hypothetical protein